VEKSNPRLTFKSFLLEQIRKKRNQTNAKLLEEEKE